jgi:hypothetical protein
MHTHVWRWRCASHLTTAFSTREDYINHMREVHKSNLSDIQLRVLADRNARRPGKLFETCPLCGHGANDGRLLDHIVGHLRSLALKSLPSYEEVPDGSEDEHDSLDTSRSRSRSTTKDLQMLGDGSEVDWDDLSKLSLKDPRDPSPEKGPALDSSVGGIFNAAGSSWATTAEAGAQNFQDLSDNGSTLSRDAEGYMFVSGQTTPRGTRILSQGRQDIQNTWSSRTAFAEKPVVPQVDDPDAIDTPITDQVEPDGFLVLSDALPDHQDTYSLRPASAHINMNENGEGRDVGMRNSLYMDGGPANVMWRCCECFQDWYLATTPTCLSCGHVCIACCEKWPIKRNRREK